MLKDSHKVIGKENIAQDELFNSGGWVQGDYTQKALTHWSKGIICQCLIKHSENDPILRQSYKKASNNQHLRILYQHDEAWISVPSNFEKDY